MNTLLQIGTNESNNSTTAAKNAANAAKRRFRWGVATLVQTKKADGSIVTEYPFLHGPGNKKDKLLSSHLMIQKPFAPAPKEKGKTWENFHNHLKGVEVDDGTKVFADVAITTIKSRFDEYMKCAAKWISEGLAKTGADDEEPPCTLKQNIMFMYMSCIKTT